MKRNGELGGPFNMTYVTLIITADGFVQLCIQLSFVTIHTDADKLTYADINICKHMCSNSPINKIYKPNLSTHLRKQLLRCGSYYEVNVAFIESTVLLLLLEIDTCIWLL